MTVETDSKVVLLIPVDLGRIPVEEHHCNSLVAVDRTCLEEKHQLRDETCELIVWPCITCRSQESYVRLRRVLRLLVGVISLIRHCGGWVRVERVYRALRQSSGG